MRLTCILGLSAAAHGLVVPTPLAKSEPLSRRALLGMGSGAALAALVGPLAASADTTPELGGATTEAFDLAAEKRKKFMEGQKKFKKAWRAKLSDLEFAQTDAEATEAVDGLYTLIMANNQEIPEGIRKMDLDQVYKIVKPRLNKDARMNFQKLDALVLKIVTTKKMGEED